MRRYKSRHFPRALTYDAESKHRQQLDRGCMQQNSVHDTEWCKPDKYKVWIKSLQDEVCRDESRIQTEDNVDTRLSGLCVSCQLLSVLFVNWVETNKLLRFTHFLHFMLQFKSYQIGICCCWILHKSSGQITFISLKLKCQCWEMQNISLDYSTFVANFVANFNTQIMKA